MTSTVLPFQNKLSGNYSKKVSFKNFVCVAHNQYIRKIGNGLACMQVTYFLKYIELTQVELTEVETLFSTHDIDSYIAWEAPIDFKSFNYRKPLTWQKESYTIHTGTTGATVKERRFNVSFNISMFLGPQVFADYLTHFGILLAVNDSAVFDPIRDTQGYLQALDNDTLPYQANGFNYDIQLFDGQSFAKTVTVAGEGTWSIDNYGAVSFLASPTLTTEPTPLQYAIWDRWYRKSNYATISFITPPLDSITGVSGWYGGELNANEIYVVSKTINILGEFACTLYPINKTTLVVGSANANFDPNYSLICDILKLGNKFVHIRDGVRVHNIDTTLEGAYNIVNATYSVASDSTNLYLVENHGGSWGYTVKRNSFVLSSEEGTREWLFDVDYPSNAQTLVGGEQEKLLYDSFADNLLQLSPLIDKLFIISKTSNGLTIANTRSGVAGTNYIAQQDIPYVISLDVISSEYSTIACNASSIIVTNPVTGKIAVISKTNNYSVSYVDIAGLTSAIAKPSYIAWLPGVGKFAISCLGDNTVKFVNSAGTVLVTRSFATAPAQAFEVGNITYIPSFSPTIYRF